MSTVNALQTPMINASMVILHLTLGLLVFIDIHFLMSCFLQVLCDRHFGGINYPVGGVGEIAKSLAKGLVNQGSQILYRANVTSIILDNGKAVSLGPITIVKLLLRVFIPIVICKTVVLVFVLDMSLPTLC